MTAVLSVFVLHAIGRHQFLTLTLESAAEDIFSEVHDGIVLADPSGVVQWCNPAAESLLGRSLERCRGERAERLLPGLDRIAETGDRTISLRRDGRRLTLDVSRAEAGVEHPDTGQLLILRDVTDILDAEEELRHARDRLERVAWMRSEELRRAHEAESMGTVASEIAHDFNNLLTSITGFTTAARDELQPGHAARKDVAEVLTAAARARQAVRQLLTYSRRQEPALRKLLLQEVVDRAVDFLQVPLPATITVEKRTGGPPCHVRGDTTQLQQVIVNLGTNAYEAMRDEGGVLEIGVGGSSLGDEEAAFLGLPAGGEYARVTVRDTGPGIPEEDMARIFDPFFSTRDGGSGLGLTTVQRIVQQHGGTIRARTGPRRGTTFEVLLPRIEVIEEAEPGVLAAASTTGPVPQGRNEHVLLVDDDRALLRITARWLTHQGYQVTPEADSRRALDAVRRAPQAFDLVITDLTMPGLTGDVLAAELGELRRDLPVIIISGHLTRDSAETGAAGRVTYLAKACDRSVLASVIRQCLDGWPGGGA